MCPELGVYTYTVASAQGHWCRECPALASNLSRVPHCPALQCPALVSVYTIASAQHWCLSTLLGVPSFGVCLHCRKCPALVSVYTVASAQHWCLSTLSRVPSSRVYTVVRPSTRVSSSGVYIVASAQLWCLHCRECPALVSTLSNHRCKPAGSK